MEVQCHISLYQRRRSDVGSSIVWALGVMLHFTMRPPTLGLYVSCTVGVWDVHFQVTENSPENSKCQGHS